ncbi:MAG TPA: hypothetical protein PKZ40_02945, partial [Anaerolineaceae bacterium]|nr:hypothetical protein [Anaerolineaceae bacterium]
TSNVSGRRGDGYPEGEGKKPHAAPRATSTPDENIWGGHFHAKSSNRGGVSINQLFFRALPVFYEEPLFGGLISSRWTYMVKVSPAEGI